MSKQNLKVHGHSPSNLENIIKSFYTFTVRLFKLDGKSYISNWFFETLNPQVLVKSKIDQKIRFLWRTGHNRLLWRAKTFDTEEPMMVKWLSSFNENDVFLDIGANAGIYTIPAAQICKKCIAFELDPINISLMKENIVLNSLTSKVIIIPIALSDKNTLESIYFRSCSKGDALQSIGQPQKLKTRIYSDNHSMVSVTCKLSDLYRYYDLPYPTKVKIDVDGNEQKVYAGGKDIILQSREIYFEHSGEDDCNQILEDMINNGFIVLNKEVPINSKGGINYLLRNKLNG